MAMTSSDLVVGIALLAAVLRWCEGTVQCLCSTPECQSKHDILCNTDSLCYVQYTPPGPSIDPDTPVVVRGCIDGNTPLLCENQRPGVYSGSWPVLYCCKTDLCNKDAVPTLPSWANDIKDSRQNSTREMNASHPTVNRHGSSKDKGQSFAVNPLYVGVPVAGACVLLAIIIFAIYILRKQTQMYEEQYQRQKHLKRRLPYCQNTCRYVTMTIGSAARTPTATTPTCHHFAHAPPGCVYADCDRSSNGSESRLLAHV